MTEIPPHGTQPADWCDACHTQRTRYGRSSAIRWTLREELGFLVTLPVIVRRAVLAVRARCLCGAQDALPASTIEHWLSGHRARSAESAARS